MTGIVMWETSWNSHPVKLDPGNIQLEFSYLLPSDVSTGPGVYDWSGLDAMLDRIAGRGHQGIVRFRYAYPGRTTGVPDWLKASPNYQETSGQSEGQLTWFPDWTSTELMDFHLDFYQAFAERYDDDPRVAFLQVGFGLWAEYHIYDGPNAIGVQFPSHDFQRTFIAHLDAVLPTLRWSVSIDAGSSYYAPFASTPGLRDTRFGLFDDSFMHANHGGYNTTMWTFFGYATRSLTSPHGGEFSYYTTFDQEHVLDLGGIHGRVFEDEAQKFGISYIIGNGQPHYQTTARIREAGRATGYRLRVTSFESCDGVSTVGLTNDGAAPMYYDAWVTVNGVRAATSLQGLAPGDTATFVIPTGVPVTGVAPTLAIEGDRLVPGQTIDFEASLP